MLKYYHKDVNGDAAETGEHTHTHVHEHTHSHDGHMHTHVHEHDHELFSPWDSPGKNTGGGSHCLLQGIFLTQGSNPGLLHYKKIHYHLSHPWGVVGEMTVNCVF